MGLSLYKKQEMFNKKLKERVGLLEHENEMLIKQIEDIRWAFAQAGLAQPSPRPPAPRVFTEDGHDLSYETLKKKYR